MAFNADNLRELFAGELVNGSGIKMTDLKKWAVLELWRELLKSRCANARPCPHHAHTMPTPCALRGHALVYLTHACLHFVAWLSRARAEGAPGDQICSPGHPLPETQGAASSIAVADELQAVEVGLRVCTNGPFGCCCMRVVFFRKCVLEVQNRRFFFGSRLSALAGLGYSWGRRAKKGADLACPRGS